MSMVIITNTCVDPRTVMIVFSYTSIAAPTMLTTQRFADHTVVAEMNVVKISALDQF